MKEIYKKLEEKYSGWSANDGGLTMAAMDNLDELAILRDKCPTVKMFREYVGEQTPTAVEDDIFYELHIKSAAATLGRKGGRVKSERKTAAVRENGKKGGRPRKTKAEGRE